MPLHSNLQYLISVNHTNPYQLSIDSGIANSTIYGLLSGQRQGRRHTINALSAALHCKPEDLTGDSLPLHIRQWPPDKQACERQLSDHLTGIDSPDSSRENMAVIARMMSRQPQNQPADSVLPAAPVSLSLPDLQALFDACVDDNPPDRVFAHFGKAVYQLMVEARDKTTK